MKFLGFDFTVYLGDVADIAPMFMRRPPAKKNAIAPARRSVLLLSWERKAL